MKWLVFELIDRTVMGMYEAPEVNLGAIGSSLPLLHIELPEGVLPTNCVLTGNEGTYEVIAGAPLQEPAAVTPAEIAAASEAGRRKALTSARYCIVTKFNQGLTHDQWTGYDESLPGDKVPIVIPVKSKLREITFSWPETSVDGIFQMYKNGKDIGNIVFSHTFSNSGPSVVNGIEIQLEIGDLIRGRWKDSGENPTDAAITYVLEVIDDG